MSFFCLLLRTGKIFLLLFLLSIVCCGRNRRTKKNVEQGKIEKMNCLLEMGDSVLFIEFDLKFKWGIFSCWIYPRNKNNNFFLRFSGSGRKISITSALKNKLVHDLSYIWNGLNIFMHWKWVLNANFWISST